MYMTATKGWKRQESEEANTIGQIPRSSSWGNQRELCYYLYYKS